MATLSMALCQGSSCWSLPTKGVDEIVERPSSLTPRNSSAKQISLVHCRKNFTEPHSFQLRRQASAVSHTLAAITGIQQARPSNISKQPHHELLHSGCAMGECVLCCQKSWRTLKKNPKRVDFYLTRNANVVLRSLLPSNTSARMIPGLQAFSWHSISDLMTLKRFHPTIPRSRSKKWELGVGVGEDLPAKYQDDDPLKQLPQRRCGVLLHPTSLPGPHGIGDLGKDAYNFIDWLKETGCTVWQVLPLVPPGRRGGEDGSPYAGVDANCSNTLLISLDCLVHDGLLSPSDLPKPLPVKRMNSAKVAAAKDPLIAKAAAKLASMTSGKLKDELAAFRKDPNISTWLEEAALFAAIDQATKAKTWWTWPSHLRDRDPNALKSARSEHKAFIDTFVAAQFLFQRQWQALHKYANDAGIKILGDMPFYVGGHSADVWAHRALFELDAKSGAPTLVSGVPPDAFSATGQLWGSPLYNWKEMAKDKYSWWSTRLRRAFHLYDEFRIDHFRGFAGYWSVPASASNAMAGKWRAGPGKAFFTAMKEAVGKKIDIVAEDLGVITSDVVALRKDLHAPGMAVLQFAFGNNARNPHLPHNHEHDQVVYPGTHDNDTCVGWWKKISDCEKSTVRKYLRFKHNDEDAAVHWELIRAAIASVARTAIIPMQDLMGLDNSARMNIPATQAGNWGWRVGERDVFQKLPKEQKRLLKLLCRYNRVKPDFVSKLPPKVKEKKKEKAVDAPSVFERLASTGNAILHQVAEKVIPCKEKSPQKEKTVSPFETMKDAAQKVNDGKEKVKEKVNDGKEKVKEKVNDGKEKVNDGKEKVKEKVNEKPVEKGKEKHGKDGKKK